MATLPRPAFRSRWARPWRPDDCEPDRACCSVASVADSRGVPPCSTGRGDWNDVDPDGPVRLFVAATHLRDLLSVVEPRGEQRLRRMTRRARTSEAPPR